MGKRILWLSNEKWTREYEVPHLVGAGYEVYCPKVCGYGLGESFLNVDYSYDSSLTLPEDVLEELNKTDLYKGLDETVCEILDKYFDIVFLPPMATVIRDYVHHFTGSIVLRFLGDEEGLTCTERLVKDCGYHLLYEINRIKDRFFFAYPFKEYVKDECDLLRGRGLFMPLPLSERQPQQNEGPGQILLNCPNISLDVKANRQFQSFFPKMKVPFAVYGEQLVPYDHRKELFIGGEKDKLLDAAAAIDLGLESTLVTEPWAQELYNKVPLLYTEGSRAKVLLGTDSPGFCKDVNAVVNKANRLSRGDTRFADSIVNYQDQKLDYSVAAFCDVLWLNSLERIEREAQIAAEAPKRNKKIGIILTEAYLGEVLEFSKRFALSLQEEAKRRNESTDFVFAHVHDGYYTEADCFGTLAEAGITVREIRTKYLKQAAVNRMLGMAGFLPKSFHGKKSKLTGILYDDDLHYMMDCDYLINVTDGSGTQDPILPIYPFAVVSHGYIDRYSPVGETFRKNEKEDSDEEEEEPKNKRERDKIKKLAKERMEEKHGVFIRYGRNIGAVIADTRNADHVFVTTQPGYGEALQFAMIKENNLKLIPPLYEMQTTKALFEKGKKNTDKQFIVWNTNVSRHKNHIKALKALKLYYKNGGILDCIISGEYTDLLDPEKEIKGQYRVEMMDYVDQIRQFISNDPLLKEKLSFKGYLPQEEQKKLLRDAAFVFHPGFADSGSITAVEAASLGTPALSNDYPAMRYLSEYAQIECRFTDINDYGATAEALKWMETNYSSQASKLSFDKMRRKSLNKIKDELYNAVSGGIGFDMRLSL